MLSDLNLATHVSMAGPSMQPYATKTAMKATRMMAQLELSASDAARNTGFLEVSAGKDGNLTFHSTLTAEESTFSVADQEQ